MSSNDPGSPRGSSHIAGALTFPPRNEDRAQPIAEQPRQPTNLQGLLRFAMEATKAEDAPGTPGLGPMDEERRKFLEEALKNLTVDMVALLTDRIKVLSDAEKVHAVQFGDPVPPDVFDAFASLMEFIDDMDVAVDFYKLGGYAVFPVCYGSENEDIRAMASSLLAELCQNNIFCQSRALESGLLNVLMNLAQTEQGEALCKCLYAISCICREYPPACKEFLAQDGCALLVSRCSVPDTRARTKAAFFIQYLCEHYPEAREKFIELNLIKTLTEEIAKGHDQSSEHLINTILTLTEDQDPRILAQCRDPALGLKKTLELHLKHPDLKEDTFREEVDYCQEILCKVFLHSSEDEEVLEEVDR